MLASAGVSLTAPDERECGLLRGCGLHADRLTVDFFPIVGPSGAGPENTPHVGGEGGEGKPGKGLQSGRPSGGSQSFSVDLALGTVAANPLLRRVGTQFKGGGQLPLPSGKGVAPGNEARPQGPGGGGNVDSDWKGSK
mmetsp:Transcript_47335/g.86971  ORF Transcript_47335/g.86971 Transcript_47335/m.86971 type:complete len:138 (-) Transcript_47335:1930-2343(-)